MKEDSEIDKLRIALYFLIDNCGLHDLKSIQYTRTSENILMGSQQSTLSDEIDSSDLDRRDPPIFLSPDLLRQIQSGSSESNDEEYPISTMSARGFFDQQPEASLEVSASAVQRRAQDILERFPIATTSDRLCASEEEAARRCAGGPGSESLVLCKGEVAAYLQCAREKLFDRLARE